jgi:hypothetical protein
MCREALTRPIHAFDEGVDTELPAFFRARGCAFWRPASKNLLEPLWNDQVEML